MQRRTFVASVGAAGAAVLGATRWSWLGAQPVERSVRRLDAGWRFIRDEASGAQLPTFNDATWEQATLPHTARIEALVTGAAGTETAQWQGICWYRRTLEITATSGRVLLRFDGAMNVADVWIDGQRVAMHLGGYLPFVADITEYVRGGGTFLLAVRLDNRDNPITGPKPMAQLDFNMYHGLYRSVYLIETDGLHITDPLLAGRPAGGGVFVTIPDISPGVAVVHAKVHVHNARPSAAPCEVRCTLRNGAGNVVATGAASGEPLEPGGDREVTIELRVANPALWSPDSPHLHTLESAIVSDGTLIDRQEVRVGIRRFEVSQGSGFVLNGERLFLRGTNRHQEYPYIGYALSDAAQYRDAYAIKQAGFDYVRLSHYAHAPAFMDACDELGLVVMNCIPGWQYFNPDPAFVELQYQNCRDLVRRDRNHACVVLWEVALNESPVPPEVVARMHAIAHEEYPGDQCITAGWVKGYDVFLQARQHGGCTREEAVPCLVSEYGDWEYYAMNAGLKQQDFKELSPAESNSRQLRWQGERAQLQQAANFQEAHNDNQATRAFGDGLWVMFDYNRGYAPDIESSGCMDLFRLPKYSYQFFRSQRSPIRSPEGLGGKMVWIASEWSQGSTSDVRVFSNCEEVELQLNGRTIARQRPDRDRTTTHLKHPPFTFSLGEFTAGMLEARGFIDGRLEAAHEVRTPGAPTRLGVGFDVFGRPLDRTTKDTVLVHGSLHDNLGTLVSTAWENVAFGATGGVVLHGLNPFSTDAGIASIVAEVPPGDTTVSLYALAIVADGEMVRILGASEHSDGETQGFTLHFTTDGSAPTPASPRYATPVRGAPGLRAALVVDGAVVVVLDREMPTFRIPSNAPPDQREEWRHGPGA
jgi:beta-galactosidase